MYSHYEASDIAATVQQNTGFPGVTGFLDGTHIGGDNDYYNRKGFPSMQLQIVVDHELTIISAYTGWPGCTHDARVLRNSLLFQNAGGQLFSQSQCLFADNAYPLRNWLITPFKNVGNQLTNQQRRFNAKFAGQRQAVERAIGHLKGRFRRLREVPFHSAKEVCNLILAACICHNICVLCEDDVERYIEHDGQLHPNNYPNIYQNGHHGVARRLQLLNVV